MARPHAVPITLSADEREVLLGWARRPKTAQALALRARIVLAPSEPEQTNTGIAQELGITTMTVAKWRGRFATRRLEGLHDEPRPGAPRTITDAHVEQVITTTLEHASRGDALEHAPPSVAPGDEPVGGLSHLESLRPSAPPE